MYCLCFQFWGRLHTVCAFNLEAEGILSLLPIFRQMTYCLWFQSWGRGHTISALNLEADCRLSLLSILRQRACNTVCAFYLETDCNLSLVRLQSASGQIAICLWSDWNLSLQAQQYVFENCSILVILSVHCVNIPPPPPPPPLYPLFQSAL